jgi:hypothetical protein
MVSTPGGNRAIERLSDPVVAAAAMLQPPACLRGISTGVGDNSCWIFVTLLHYQ